MPLKKNEIQKFKTRLLELRQKITHTLSETQQEVKRQDESTGYSQHQADQGTDDFDRTINLELTQAEMHILRQIDHALEKVEEGTYCICDITQEEIPLRRLEALPYASMTVESQDKFEKGLL